MIRRRKPIAKVGARGKRLAPLLNQLRRAVRERSKGWCEVNGCRLKASDCHHVFGRGGTGARLGDRWANHPALGTDLCYGHHQQFHRGRDREFISDLQWAAICRLAIAEGTEAPVVPKENFNANDYVRQMIRDLEP